MTYSSIRNSIQRAVYAVIDPLVGGALAIGITPNMVTTLGMLGNVAGAALVVYAAINAAPGDYSLIGWAGLVIILSSVLDMVDGYMARKGGKESRFGAFYDSVLDRYSELFTLAALSFYFVATGHHWAAVITYASLIGSLMVSYTRARAEGLQAECKVGLMQRPERVVLTVAGMLLCGMLQGVFSFSSLWFVIATQAIIAFFSNITAIHRIVHVKGQLLLACLFLSLPLAAQTMFDEADEGIDIKTEVQGSFSSGNTPLWLNANKYGLSSLKSSNGYLRVGAERLAANDSARLWRFGYGADVAVPVGYTSKFIIQQLYAEFQYKLGTLTIGQREQPMQMLNNELSSGEQTFGRNARPVPQVRLAMLDYFRFLHGWVGIKGHISYGWCTDGGFQESFAAPGMQYAKNVLYHEKSGFLRIGKPETFPLTLELGLEMAAQFGGTAYNINNWGTIETVKGNSGFSGYWHALVPGGADATDGGYDNAAGNQLGSWMARLKWEKETWSISAYMDHFFEDHSAMFHLNKDGYGEKEDHKKVVRNRWLLYDFKDMLLGVELHLKRFKPLNSVVMEYLNSTYQSSPIYHDHTYNISDHIAGNDNYYNHTVYGSWSHWGQVVGNPLYRSPIYNTDGTLMVKNNRTRAFHLGLSGDPYRAVHYRLLLSAQKGWGTYAAPLDYPEYNTSLLIEATVGGEVLKMADTPAHEWIKGMMVRLAYGLDRGRLLGDNSGFQITIGYHKRLGK